MSTMLRGARLKRGIGGFAQLKYLQRSFSSSRSDAPISQDELQKARKWIASFSGETIPRSSYVISYSRSSGPGGQNVNKTNSKATLQVNLKALLPHIPSVLHSSIRSSRYYAERSDALTIQADDSRKQADNARSCEAKLRDLILEVARNSIPGETSREQNEHVRTLKENDKEYRLKQKKTHSSKKAARRGSSYFE